MIQESKELLIKDLSSRLPYKTKVRYSSNEKFITCILDSVNPRYETVDLWSKDVCFTSININKVKPYLFPFSSITKEQLFEVQEILGKNEVKIYDGFFHIVDSDRNTFTFLEVSALIEWFYKNHFDIHGLIPLGLAIDAINLNIY